MEKAAIMEESVSFSLLLDRVWCPICGEKLEVELKCPIDGKMKSYLDKDPYAADTSKGVQRGSSLSSPDKTLPMCAKNCYDCDSCSKPLVAQSGRGDLAPCDGKGRLHFCKFATASTTTPACSRYDLRNYACTHGGGSCMRYKKRRKGHAF
jgi:hypothetical protein